MKPIWVILLSLLLLFGGVAWAMEACLRHGDHSYDMVAEIRHESESPLGSTYAQDPSVTVIHCTALIQHVGPALQVASIQLARSSQSVPLQVSLLAPSVEPESGNNLWLAALFKRVTTFSLPNDLARHLFLSILQI